MEKFKLEQQLKNLENLVEGMEKGTLSLEDSMRNYEAGLKIIQQCQKELNQAEQKIKILQQNQEVEFNLK